MAGVNPGERAPATGRVTLIEGSGAVLRDRRLLGLLAPGTTVAVETLIEAAEALTGVDDPAEAGRLLAGLPDGSGGIAAIADLGDRLVVLLAGPVFAEVDGSRLDPLVGADASWQIINRPAEGVGIYLAGTELPEPGTERFDLAAGLVPAAGALLHVTLGPSVGSALRDAAEAAVGGSVDPMVDTGARFRPPPLPDAPLREVPPAEVAEPESPKPELPEPGTPPATTEPDTPLPATPEPLAAGGPGPAAGTVPKKSDLPAPAVHEPQDPAVEQPATAPLPALGITDFQAKSLRDFTDLPVLPPLPVAEEVRPATDAASLAGAATEVVVGIRCSRGHLNGPETWLCAVCGIRIDPPTCTLVEGERPPMGWLLLDNGYTYQLHENIVLGREPEPDAGAERPVRVTDDTGLMSRCHAAIRLDGWTVTVVDLGSSNGTHVSGPDTHGREMRLVPHQPHRMLSGSRVRMGGRSFIYETTRDVQPRS